MQLSGIQALERGLGGKISLSRPIGSALSGEITRVDEPTCTEVCGGQRRLGRYSLLFRFAGGGMANLYAGHFVGANGFCRVVAIKVLHDHLADAAKLRQMFIDEARLCSRISHPNVVQVHELDQVDDKHFIVMEYVAGENVRRLVSRTRPSFACCARIIGEAASALHAAHEANDDQGQPLALVHCDVSPENILVSYDGVTKLIDFGVAQVHGGQVFTRVNPLKGKLAYMAPEQAASQPFDRRADIFALGIVLYEMSTRSSLFRRKTPAATLRAVVRCEVPPPAERVHGYPEQLQQIVLKALQHDPGERYQTARALQHDLEAFVRSSPNPVTTSTIQEMMTELFADRIEQRRALLLRLRTPSEGDLPDLGDLTDHWAPPLLWRIRHQWQRLSTIAAGVLVSLATLLALILHWDTSGPSDAHARTVPVGAQVDPTIRTVVRIKQGVAPVIDDARVVLSPSPAAAVKGETTTLRPSDHSRDDGPMGPVADGWRRGLAADGWQTPTIVEQGQADPAGDDRQKGSGGDDEQAGWTEDDWQMGSTAHDWPMGTAADDWQMGSAARDRAMDPMVSFTGEEAIGATDAPSTRRPLRRRAARRPRPTTGPPARTRPKRSAKKVSDKDALVNPYTE